MIKKEKNNIISNVITTAIHFNFTSILFALPLNSFKVQRRIIITKNITIITITFITITIINTS